MFTINDFSKAIHVLVTEKKYSEALDFFKLHKSEVDTQLIAQNEYLVADMFTALRGIKAFDAAHQFLKIYDLKIDEKTPLRILNSYGWLLYFEFKTSAADKPTDLIHKRVLALLALLKNTNDTYSTNLAEYLFKLAMQTQKTQATPNWNFVAQVCELTDPAKLSTSCSSIQVERRGQQKDMELASAREEWYAMHSKALYEAHKYEQCIELSQKAKTEIEKMHYTNELWFERRIAQCLVKTNKVADAIPIYLQIIPQKQDWFVLKELAECYYRVGDNSNALKYATQAASAYGPINFKIELIELLGDILHKQNKIELAHKHYKLVKLIREAEKWHVNNALDDKILTTMPAEKQLKPSNTDNKDSLKAELIPFWSTTDQKPKKQITLTKTAPKTGEKQTGSISKLLAPKPAGIDGFIKSDKGESVYFFMAASDAIFPKLTVGLRLEFQLQPAPKGFKAIKIELL